MLLKSPSFAVSFSCLSGNSCFILTCSALLNHRSWCSCLRRNLPGQLSATKKYLPASKQRRLIFLVKSITTQCLPRSQIKWTKALFIFTFSIMLEYSGYIHHSVGFSVRICWTFKHTQQTHSKDTQQTRSKDTQQTCSRHAAKTRSRHATNTRSRHAANTCSRHMQETRSKDTQQRHALLWKTCNTECCWTGN